MNGSIAKDASKASKKESIAVLGTGNFGRSLTTALIRSGYRVLVGSRHPGSRLTIDGAEIYSYEDAIQNSGIVFVALHPEHQNQLGAFESILAQKILVDVSNVEKGDDLSNAEKLQNMLPKAKVRHS